MSDDVAVTIEIDAEIRDRSTEVLAQSGLTINDAVRLLLTHTANEGTLPSELQPHDPEYDPWFRAKVQEALDDPRPPIPHEEVEAHFARRRAEALARIAKS